jgi:hypothetical protein
MLFILFYACSLSSKSLLYPYVRCRRYLNIYDDTFIRENSSEVYTWSTARVRCKYPLLHRIATLYCNTDLLRTAKHIFCFLLLFRRHPRYCTRPAPRPAAVWAPADRRRTMKRRTAPQRHIPRCSFQMTRVARTDQASSTCSSLMTRHIPATRQKVAYHRLLRVRLKATSFDWQIIRSRQTTIVRLE